MGHKKKLVRPVWLLFGAHYSPCNLVGLGVGISVRSTEGPGLYGVHLRYIGLIVPTRSMGESAVWPANPVLLIPPTTDQIICRVLCPRLRDELLLLSPYSIICTGGTQDVCTAIMDDPVGNISHLSSLIAHSFNSRRPRFCRTFQNIPYSVWY